MKSYFKKPETFAPDFSWMEDGMSFDFDKEGRNHNECKDELDKQRNDGQVLHTPENNATEKILRDNAVKVARDLMNRGANICAIKESLRSCIKPDVLRRFASDIDKQLSLYGAVGRFVLDARGYKNCQEARQQLKGNPYRRYVAYIMGCGCGGSKEVITSLTAAKREATATDMLASSPLEGKRDRCRVKSACPSTLYVKIAGQGDIDKQWAGDTMIDLMNASVNAKEEGKKITASVADPYQRLKKMFIASEDIQDGGGLHIDENLPEGNTELFGADVELDLCDDPESEIEIDLSSPSGQDIVLEADSDYNQPLKDFKLSAFDSGVALDGELNG